MNEAEILKIARREVEAKSRLAGYAPEAPATDRSTPIPPPEISAATLAANLRDNAAAGYMHWLVSSLLPKPLSTDAFKLYRDRLLVEAGNPTDPIEIQLIEQLSMAHFAIGRLYIRACSMENAKLSIAFTDAATRLLGELRRCSLALEDLRAKRIARQEPASVEQAAEKAVPAARHAASSPVVPPGKKAPPQPKQGSNNHRMEIPACLRNRMTNPTPDELQPVALIDGNGRG